MPGSDASWLHAAVCNAVPVAPPAATTAKRPSNRHKSGGAWPGVSASSCHLPRAASTRLARRRAGDTLAGTDHVPGATDDADGRHERFESAGRSARSIEPRSCATDIRPPPREAAPSSTRRVPPPPAVLRTPSTGMDGAAITLERARKYGSAAHYRWWCRHGREELRKFSLSIFRESTGNLGVRTSGAQKDW
jgi:hypothetical protein